MERQEGADPTLPSLYSINLAAFLSERNLLLSVMKWIFNGEMGPPLKVKRFHAGKQIPLQTRN